MVKFATCLAAIISCIFVGKIYAPGSQLKGKWSTPTHGLLIFTMEGVENRNKIIGFDLDYTLIRTKSGKIHAENVNDWELWDGNVVQKLKDAHDSGYKLCIFTNQGGLGTLGTLIYGVNPEDFKNKIEMILTKIGVPMQVFVAVGSGSYYRKPQVGMWEYHEKNENGRKSVDKESSKFVGDAAGRIPVDTRKADFAAFDRKFAMNLGVPFETPEQFFQGKSEEKFDLDRYETTAEYVYKEIGKLSHQLPELRQYIPHWNSQLLKEYFPHWQH